MNIKTRPFTLQEIHALFAVSPTAWRHIFKLAYVTALRVGDIINLDAKFPELEMSIVEQKTGKSKKIISGPAVKAAYEFFMNPAYRKSITKYQTTRKNKLLPFGSASTYRKATARYAAFAMIDLDRISFHSFRKTAATEITKNIGIFAAQKFLNHSRLSTTMLYIDQDAIEVSSLLEAASLIQEGKDE